MLSPDVVEFLAAMLAGQQLQVGHPRFAETSALAVKAAAELAAYEPPDE